MSIRNRTNEFQAIVRSYKSKASGSGVNKSTKDNQSEDNFLNNKTQFTRTALTVAQQINTTTKKLEELAKLSRSKSLFNDDPQKINVLTLEIKQQIATINLDLKKLKGFSVNSNNKNQVVEHQNNVVTQLQSKLANTSLTFKDVLETRTQNMRSIYNKKQEYSFNNVDNNNFQDFNNTEENSNSQHLSLDLSSEQLQQTQLLENYDTSTNVEYMNQRSNAITSIEKTIHELGSVFQQLAQMVSEQKEVVQRIDANIENVDMNVGSAQRELLKYYASISSNRALIFKVFLVVLVFFVMFIIVK